MRYGGCMDRQARQKVGEGLNTAMQGLHGLPISRESVCMLARCSSIEVFFKDEKAPPLDSAVYRTMAQELNVFSKAVSGVISPDAHSALRQVAELFLAESQAAVANPKSAAPLIPGSFLDTLTMPQAPVE
jgi:hypothetical protein